MGLVSFLAWEVDINKCLCIENLWEIICGFSLSSRIESGSKIVFGALKHVGDHLLEIVVPNLLLRAFGEIICRELEKLQA